MSYRIAANRRCANPAYDTDHTGYASRLIRTPHATCSHQSSGKSSDDARS